MNIDQSLFAVLESHKAALQKLFNRELPGMSLLYFWVLRQVGAGYGITPQLVAQKLHRDKAQVTRLVMDMEQQGLLQKLPHPQDRRSILLQLTAQGGTCLAQAEELQRQVAEKMTSGISATQQSLLDAALQQMRDNLNSVE
ncbi:MarR family winged helix-turn-helix transcriptional regulator [Shewanella dokdonensis]|uniref:MarR family transcriptional regulator n=1 Tax=Shewanella dokdonensis TaxID=712036 RepID=A0ABX8DH75_9GAMM|nr:MarR family transcriptional regulator [Shewanella dokdonensis]MCL1074425.1 MarR family transcriptional regulator [Shewanella dokdonensis]QVK24093.1 MarR family transcriptional regulator [Shewanella dokdonensis]